MASRPLRPRADASKQHPERGCVGVGDQPQRVKLTVVPVYFERMVWRRRCGWPMRHSRAPQAGNFDASALALSFQGLDGSSRSVTFFPVNLRSLRFSFWRVGELFFAGRYD